MDKITSSALRGAFVVLACITTLTHAQKPAHDPSGYPNKPIRLLVGMAPGGSIDALARAVGQKLTDRWHYSVVVDNRAGASGTIAMELAAKATSDGHTLLSASGSSLTSAALVIKVPYDVRTTFAPVVQMTSQPYVLAVSLSLPVNSIKELIAYAKSKPSVLNYASSGTGSTAHLGMEFFKSVARVDMAHIPYKGIAPGIIDLLGGHIQLLLGTTNSVMPHAKTGKLRAIAVTSRERVKLFPGLPTVSEAGLPGFVVTGWFGLFAPAGTPPAITLVLNREVSQIVNTPEMTEKIAADGAEATPPNSPAQFKDMIVKEIDMWEKFIKESGLKL